MFIEYIGVYTNACTCAIPVQSIEHFNGDQYRESHGHGVKVIKYLARFKAFKVRIISSTLEMVTLWHKEYHTNNLVQISSFYMLLPTCTGDSLSLRPSLFYSPSLSSLTHPPDTHHIIILCTPIPQTQTCTSTSRHTPLTHQLIEGNVWPSTRIHEPPSCRGDSSKPYVSTNDKVAEEEPAGDEGVLDVARGLVHDVDVWEVEAESCGWETVSDKVHPE